MTNASFRVLIADDESLENEERFTLSIDTFIYAVYYIVKEYHYTTADVYIKSDDSKLP